VDPLPEYYTEFNDSAPIAAAAALSAALASWPDADEPSANNNAGKKALFIPAF
jgi:hypothetical protein